MKDRRTAVSTGSSSTAKSEALPSTQDISSSTPPSNTKTARTKTGSTPVRSDNSKSAQQAGGPAVPSSPSVSSSETEGCDLFDYFQSELVRLQSQLKDCVPRSQLLTSENQCKELKKQLDDTTDRLRTSNVALQRLTNQVKLQDNSKQELIACQRDLCAAKETIAASVPIETYESSHTMCLELQQQVTNLKTKLAASDALLVATNKRLDEAGERISNYQELVDEYKNQLEYAKEEIQEKEEEIIEKSLHVCL